MRKVSLILAAAMILSLFPAVASAQFAPETGSIKGYMVNEYYFTLDHNSGDMDEGGIKGRHGLWFRRIYFTYGNALTDNVKMRLRLEMNSTSDLFSSESLTPFVKDAYLDIKLGGGNLVIGMQGPPSYAQVEDIWGWRPLEKTPLDLYKWQSSRDMGITYKGGTNLIYRFMFGQDSSNKSETNNGKKIYGALGYKSGGLFVEAMAQYERDKEADDDVIFQGFGAYQGDWGRVGLQYAHRSYTPENLDALLYNVASAFAVLKAGDKLEVIARCDMNFGDGYKTGFKGSGVAYVPFANNHEFSFLLAAVSWNAYKNVWVIPNIKMAMYKTNDLLDSTAGYEKPANDVYAYMTLYFKF